MMSLFATPAEHAANPPESWRVVKTSGSTPWHLTTTDGKVVLDRFRTRGQALLACGSGWAFNLYQKEARWYAGEQVEGWRPYAECAR